MNANANETFVKGMHVAQMDDTQESIKQSRKEKLGLENKIRTYHFKNNENQLICTKKIIKMVNVDLPILCSFTTQQPM